jgi:DNA-binding MarR family transcriptional regulator
VRDKAARVDAPIHSQHIALWRLHLESARLIHAAFFPAGRLGTDIGLVYVLGAVVVRHSERRASHASGLTRYLGMPRETVRRKLDQLVRRGLIRREGQRYAPTEKTLETVSPLSRLAQMIRDAADNLSAEGPEQARAGGGATAGRPARTARAF